MLAARELLQRAGRMIGAAPGKLAWALGEGHMKVLACICFLSCAVLAQEVAQISGTVTDQSGAVVPGVEVTATQTDTGAKRTVITDVSGLYVIPNLPLGPYRLEAMKMGLILLNSFVKILTSRFCF